jgi:transcriptional regulator with XRE-family HTH domain
MENARKELGKKIREIRRLKGLTQEKLGEKANLNYKFVGELERGKVNVSLDSLVRISQALEIYIGDLFRKREETVLKIIVKEKSPFSKFSSQDLHLIKKALRLLNRAFSKV